MYSVTYKIANKHKIFISAENRKLNSLKLAKECEIKLKKMIVKDSNLNKSWIKSEYTLYREYSKRSTFNFELDHEDCSQ